MERGTVALSPGEVKDEPTGRAQEGPAHARLERGTPSTLPIPRPVSQAWLPSPEGNSIVTRTSWPDTVAKFSFMMSSKIHMFFI